MIDDLTHDVYLHLGCEDFRDLRRWRLISAPGVPVHND